MEDDRTRQAPSSEPAASRKAGRGRAALAWCVLCFGALAGLGLITVTPHTARIAEAPKLPLVPAAALVASTARVVVESQGTVAPRTEVELAAEVAGRLTEVSTALASGGFFEAGDLLAQIDPADYALAVERAASAHERASSELDLARATLARRETLAQGGVASAATLDEARSRERVAHATSRDAAAALEQARRDLERTRIVAPFSGRVREKRVDRGQFVNRGTAVARIYAVDYAEIRLPIPDREAAFLDLPFSYRAAAEGEERGPAVVLRARFAGRELSWTGRVVRTEGEIDPRTRMLHAVARVEDPYGRWAFEARPPLAVGLFVHAEIEGRPLLDVYDVPRAALRGSEQVLVIDRDDRVRLRPVEVLRTQGDRAFLRGGVEPGDRLALAPLGVPIEGTQVRTAAAAGEAIP